MSMPLPSEASVFPLMLRVRFLRSPELVISKLQVVRPLSTSLLSCSLCNDSLCDSLERKENPCYVSAHASLWALSKNPHCGKIEHQVVCVLSKNPVW